MSNLINKTRLQKFATDLWEKIKGRYDNTFKEAEITASTDTAKKITLTRVNDTTKEISLADYARLQDRNEFKQDVSADNVGMANNSNIGSAKGFDSQNRGLGFRQLTTSAFVDGYVDHIRIYVDSANTGATSTWKVWAITKGATNRNEDRVKKVVHQSINLNVQSITEGSVERKFVIIPIKESFENETYFIARCSTHKVEVAQTIDPKYVNDVVNLNNVQPPDAENSEISWNVNAEGNTAIMYLYGRESIGSLALKLKQTQADGGLYVKQAEVSVTSEANKVVRLGADGKLDKDMLPSIAINEYFRATDFTHAELAKLTFQNGDVVVVTKNTKTKRYLCVDKDNNLTNLTEAFVELNDKSGVVTGVEGRTGNVTLALETTDDKFRLKINGDGGAEVVKEVDIISEAEINSIISGLN